MAVRLDNASHAIRVVNASDVVQLEAGRERRKRVCEQSRRLPRSGIRESMPSTCLPKSFDRMTRQLHAACSHAHMLTCLHADMGMCTDDHSWNAVTYEAAQAGEAAKDEHDQVAYDADDDLIRRNVGQDRVDCANKASGTVPLHPSQHATTCCICAKVRLHRGMGGLESVSAHR